MAKNLWKTALLVSVKVVLLLTCLYFFICSLSFLSNSFRILGGRNIGSFFADSKLLQNPIVGVMIGNLVTVLVQSSSTSTSIIVGLVAAGAAPVSTAIPMIMGANIGTSVTNTIVSFTQAGDRNEFRRAFACATVHDMFNWLTVGTMLLIEVLTGFLEFITSQMVHSIGLDSDVKNPDFLKTLTNPFTKSVIQLDKAVLKGWAQNDVQFANATTILKTHCKDSDKNVLEVCPYLFAYLGPEGYAVKDVSIGILLLVLSVCMLSFCLLGMVKCLNSLLGTEVRAFIEKVINTDIPVRGLGWLTGYLFMLFGTLMTILVQSSSVFTSTLTPLAGAGLISLQRVYPMTLGSNIGTTTTSLLASMAAGGSHVAEALQIALVHLFFNISGILLFYPIPFMRWPIPMAESLGNITAQYRWFSLVYLIFMFFLMPLFVFGVSLGGAVAMYIVFVPLSFLFAIVIVINLLQNQKPSYLPEKLRNWHFLPIWLYSLEPYDTVITRLFGCFSCCQTPTTSNSTESTDKKHPTTSITTESTDKKEKEFIQMDNLAYQSETH